MLKYLKQITIIFVICLIGEVLNYLIPLPIPASVYGLVIMLVCLCTKVIKVKQVKETSDFLLGVMPLLFVPSVVGIMEVTDIIKDNIIPVLVIIFVTTIIVMVASGLTTQSLIRAKNKSKKKKRNKKEV